MIRTLALPLLCSMVALAQRLPPQRTTSARAGTIYLLQGSASIDGVPVRVRSGFPVQMNNGQRVHVDWGRVELTLGPGAALSMTMGSTLHMQENHLNDIRVDLEEGSALVKVSQIYKGWRLRVMVPGGAAELHPGGWYRFDANPQRLRVYRGGTEVVLRDSVIKAKKGLAVDFSEGSVSPSDLNNADPLIAWALQRDRETDAFQKRRAERSAMQRARRVVQIEERQDIDQARRRVPPMPSPPAQ